MKAGLPETPSKEKWISQVLKSGDRVGVDPALISLDSAEKFKEALAKSGQTLVPIEDNLIDIIWKEDHQPPFNPQLIEHLPIQFSGKASSAKIGELCNYLQLNSYSAFIVTALDEIACKISYFYFYFYFNIYL